MHVAPGDTIDSLRRDTGLGWFCCLMDWLSEGLLGVKTDLVVVIRWSSEGFLRLP